MPSPHAVLDANVLAQAYVRDLLLDASDIKEPLGGLRIDWDENGADVTAQFALSASDDPQTWRSVFASATCCD